MVLDIDMTKEQLVLSDESKKKLREMDRLSDIRHQDLIASRPMVPDGSGQQGAYDELISHAVRRPAFKTESGKFFYKTEGGYEMIGEELLARVREHIRKYS